MTNEDILSLIQRAIKDFNEQNLADEKLPDTPDTPLFGKEGCLDSLGLVNLILTVEEKISDELDLIVVLADERAMSRKTSPFRTVGSLADYVVECIEND